MATKVLSPFKARIRMRNEINVPKEDFRIRRGHDDFEERRTSEPIADREKSHLNTDSTPTTNACAIKLHDGMDSERDEKTQPWTFDLTQRLKPRRERGSPFHAAF